MQTKFSFLLTITNDPSGCQRSLGKNQSLGKCHFLPGGGLLNIGGIRYFFLDQKGDQQIFSSQKGGSLLFFKRNNIICYKTFQVPEKGIVRCNLGMKIRMGHFKSM